MNTTPELKALCLLGYSERVDEERTALDVEYDRVARVTAEHKGAYEVSGVDGTHRAVVTGRRMAHAESRDDYPAVGDWVVITIKPDGSRVISQILQRRTTLHKKRGGRDAVQLVAANIDVALIVETINRDYSLSRFERYLVLAREGGVTPVIILNKSDLYDDDLVRETIVAIRERFGDIDVLTTSTVSDGGLRELTDCIKSNTTYCFVGSSGVGKSSLINTLLEQNSIATTEISDKTGRGMHTTTARQMYFTKGGAIIIDNPGSREVGTINSRTGVDEVFADIDELLHQCKFSNCRHGSELGCAITHALKSGELDAARYENYRKLQKETAAHEAKMRSRSKGARRFSKFTKQAGKKPRK